MITVPRYDHASLFACLYKSRARCTSSQRLLNLTSSLCHPIPSIETCLPSIVSCTSAFLLVVAVKLLAPACHFASLLNLIADLESGVRSILGNRIKGCGKRANVLLVDNQMPS